MVVDMSHFSHAPCSWLGITHALEAPRASSISEVIFVSISVKGAVSLRSTSSSYFNAISMSAIYRMSVALLFPWAREV